jgi:hypothetical protein
MKSAGEVAAKSRQVHYKVRGCISFKSLLTSFHTPFDLVVHGIPFTTFKPDNSLSKDNMDYDNLHQRI